MIGKLAEIGFSEYEAKAYLALLAKSPSTAYEIAKNASLPTSKIYGVLSRLLERGAVSEIDSSKTNEYVPLPPDELISSYRDKMDKTLSSLKDGLKKVSANSDFSLIRNVRDYGYLMDKAARLIEGAKESLLVSIWPEEMEILKAGIEKRAKKKVKTAIVHFGAVRHSVGQMYYHPIEDTIYTEKGGRVLIIVADSKEVLMGRIDDNNNTEGAVSGNEGFVAMAEDYIKHDIYIMKVVERFDDALVGRFGKNYPLLRDVFSDSEL